MNPEGELQAGIQPCKLKGQVLLKTSFSGKELAGHRLCQSSCALDTLLHRSWIQRLILLTCLQNATASLGICLLGQSKQKKPLRRGSGNYASAVDAAARGSRVVEFNDSHRAIPDTAFSITTEGCCWFPVLPTPKAVIYLSLGDTQEGGAQAVFCSRF